MFSSFICQVLWFSKTLIGCQEMFRKTSFLSAILKRIFKLKIRYCLCKEEKEGTTRYLPHWIIVYLIVFSERKESIIDLKFYVRCLLPGLISDYTIMKLGT